MLEGLALAAMIERCAPNQPVPTLAAIVRRASGGEPLVIGLTQNGKPITVVAPSKEDAIAFVASARVAGQHVRVGLAGVDTRHFEQIGLSIADAFEPCANLRSAARLLDRGSITPPPLPIAKPVPKPNPDASSDPRTEQPARSPETVADAGHERPARAWDVYGQARSSASLVYAPPR